ncbi:hypothetical protein GF359_09155, partial [candidate division WOR-3 bacterium]|nr:hypothetical protein [candidate division WOR-3 bacterium]MBD3365366.1 hypothetical protein [candidate division WOR-3 bacterium]
MKRFYLSGGIALFMAVSFGTAINAQVVLERPDDYQMSRTVIPEEEKHYFGHIDELRPLPQDDEFATYAYTYDDMVIFSYDEENFVQVLDIFDNPVWSGTIPLDSFAIVDGLADSVYMVLATGEFTVVSGDPWGMGLGTWCAVDENSRPVSTKLLSVGPKYLQMSGNYAEGVIAVFAYANNTHVIVRNLDTDGVIWEGDLNAGDHYYYRHDDPTNPRGFPYSVEASRPVSALTLNGMGGVYIPSFNGTFVGRDFLTYSPYCYQNGDVTKNVAVLPWEDDTRVIIVDLDNPEDTIWDKVCPTAGVIEGTVISLPRRDQKLGRGLKIHSDKDITFMNVPYATYGNNIIGFYIMAGIDRNGLGIGTEFHVPLVCSGGAGYATRLHVIAYSDNTSFTVTRTPKLGGAEEPIASGTLDRGEYYRFTAASWDVTQVGTYHVVADKGVGTIVNCYDDNGATFLPLWFALHPNIAATPSFQFEETECLVPFPYLVYAENNGNAPDTINLNAVDTKYPEFDNELFDELGLPLYDTDGDGRLDTDIVGAGGRFGVTVEVTPVDKLPFGYVDTCVFSVQSVIDTSKHDTALLVTTIREIEVDLDPDTVIVNAYPGENAVFDLDALHTSWYRPDTLNFDYRTTIPESQWPVELSEGGTPLTDDDGDGMVDIDSVPEGDPPVPVPMQVTVSI